MQEFAVDAALGVLLLEALAVLVWWRRTANRVKAIGLMLTLLSGATLVLALRASIRGDGFAVIALWLAVALVAHVSDMRWRFRAHRRFPAGTECQ